MALLDPPEALHDVLATLLGTRATSDACISVASLRAVHVAFGERLGNVAQLAERFGARLVGSALMVPSDAPVRVDSDRHAAVASALLAGSPSLADVLRDLASHAVRAGGERRRAFLERALIASAAADLREPSGLLVLVDARDELDAGDRAWFSERLFDMARAKGLVRRDRASVEALGDAAVRAHRALGDESGAARVTMGLILELGRSTERVDEVLRDDPAGWGALLQAVEARGSAGRTVESQRLDRLALRAAVERGDAKLESRCATSIAASLMSGRDFDTAIGWARRGWLAAEQGEHWGELCNSSMVLSSAYLLNLQVADAVRVIDRLCEVVDRFALSAHVDYAQLLRAYLSVAIGDRRSIERWQRTITSPSGSPTPRAVGDAIAHAEILAAAGVAGSGAAWRLARELVALAHEDQGFRAASYGLRCALIEWDVDPSSEPWRRLPGLMGRNEPGGVAMALTRLSRQTALRDDPDLAQVLADALDATPVGACRLLELARREAGAARARDSEVMELVAAAWIEHEFMRDGALATASAAALHARSNAGARAEQLFSRAHELLLANGFERDLEEVRAARARLSGEFLRREARRHSEDRSAVLSALVQVAMRRTVGQGASFPAGFVCMIVDGLATLHAGDDTHPYALVGPGALVGMEAKVWPQSAAGATAVTPCVVETVPHAALAEAPLVDGLLAVMVEQQQRGLDIATRSAPASVQVAQVLAGLLPPAGVSGEAPQRLVLPRTVVAAVAGMSRETVSRAMKRLAAAGVIGLEGRSIVVLDAAALRSWTE